MKKKRLKMRHGSRVKVRMASDRVVFGKVIQIPKIHEQTILTKVYDKIGPNQRSHTFTANISIGQIAKVVRY